MALSDNLIFYLSLDEASGNAIDAHAANDFTDNNTVGSATGKVGNGRDFEKDNQEYFTIADNSEVATGDIDFTIQAWIKHESASAGGILGTWDGGGGTGREYLLYTTGGTAYFLVSSNGSSQSAFINTGSFSTGTWYLLHAWHDAAGNQIGLSVNAGTPTTSSYSSGVYNSGSTLDIGRSGGGPEYFDGVIDEVAFWKRVLTSDERTELYNSGSGRDYSYITGGGGGGTSFHGHRRLPRMRSLLRM